MKLFFLSTKTRRLDLVVRRMFVINNSLLGLWPPQSQWTSSISAMGCVYLSISWLEMGAGLKNNLRVSRVGPRGSLDAFFFLLNRVISQRLAMVRRKGEQTHLKSTVQRRVVCCIQEGWIAPEKEYIDSLPIGWTIGVMIYFTGEVFGSSPRWPNCAREKTFFFLLY